MIEGDYKLPNGRLYRVTNTGEPYVGGEYPKGGFIIRTWLNDKTGWVYIDNSPTDETVLGFLLAAERLGPPPKLEAMKQDWTKLNRDTLTTLKDGNVNGIKVSFQMYADEGISRFFQARDMDRRIYGPTQIVKKSAVRIITDKLRCDIDQILYSGTYPGIINYETPEMAVDIRAALLDQYVENLGAEILRHHQERSRNMVLVEPVRVYLDVSAYYMELFLYCMVGEKKPDAQPQKSSQALVQAAA